MEVIYLESAARSAAFVDVVASLIAEKIHAAVARHWLSTLASRDYVYALEKKEFDSFVAAHRTQLVALRASVSPEAVAKKISDATEEEVLARKKIILLEDKVFNDFFLELGRMLLAIDPTMLEDDPDGSAADASASADGVLHAKPRVGPFLLSAAQRASAEDAGSPIAGGTQMTKRRVRLGRDGKPLVHLCDGCPFIRAEDCPFYAAHWISKETFIEQHMARRLPRLKAPLRLEQISYDKLLAEREHRVTQMNLRLYHSRLLN